MSCSTSTEPRGILGKENSKPIPVKKVPLHRSVSFTEPEHERKVDKQIGRCKSAATLETMLGFGSDSGECCRSRFPEFVSDQDWERRESPFSLFVWSSVCVFGRLFCLQVRLPVYKEIFKSLLLRQTVKIDSQYSAAWYWNENVCFCCVGLM